MIDHNALVDRTATIIVTNRRQILLTFLVVTIIFAFGLPNITVDAGTSQFADDSDAIDAFDNVNQDFTPTFDSDPSSTQIVQSRQNTLAKPALLDMLTVQHRLENKKQLHVTNVDSVAQSIALILDPSAQTTDDKIRAIERATHQEIETAARQATANPDTQSLLSTDFNQQSPSASATIAVVTHDVEDGEAIAGSGETTPLTTVQLQTQDIAHTVDNDMRVIGGGLISNELSNVITDSLFIVVPAAILLILLFMTLAYRDPLDLLLGAFALLLAVVWTFGFIGLAGIAFTQMLIAIPPLLLAVGIDFGIHTINRYREAKTTTEEINTAMNITVHQLIIAFFIVTATTVLGFSANISSGLSPIQEFGLVASIGILFTFCIFGIFLPAAKVELEHLRANSHIPTFSTTPLGKDGSSLAHILSGGVTIAQKAPLAFLLCILVLSLGAGAYGTGVDTSFSEDDFLPPENQPGYLQELPEPFKPNTYSVTTDRNYIENTFTTTESDTVTLYITDDMRNDAALESIHRAGKNPPDAVVTTNRHAQSTSIITIINTYAEQNNEFNALVERNDQTGNGIPDKNLETIYDELLDSPMGAQAQRYITDDYRTSRVVYTIKSDATQDETAHAGTELERSNRLSSVATGQTIVFKDVSDTILRSAIISLSLALIATAIFLMLIYHILERNWRLGVVNLVPIVVTIALIAGSMRLLNIPFNALTATVLSVSIGLGIDYSAHIVHRFTDEYTKTADTIYALNKTVRGTGGALTGSMLTTTAGIGVLALAITPILGQFGIVTAMSIFYSYLTAVFVTPSALLLWAEFTQN